MGVGVAQKFDALIVNLAVCAVVAELYGIRLTVSKVPYVAVREITVAVAVKLCNNVTDTSPAFDKILCHR